MKVLLLSRYGNLGASSRVRLYQYIPYLKKENIYVTAVPLFNDDYVKNLYEKNTRKATVVLYSYLKRLLDLAAIKKYDLVWIEKELFPMLPLWIERIIALLKIPYIVDYDDAIFHNYDMNANRIVRFLLGSKIKKIMRKAALVITGSPYLTEYALNAGANVFEIPTVIDLEKYPIEKPKEPDIFTIGWIGSPSTQMYLLEILPALKEFCSKYKSKIILIGANEIIQEKFIGLPVEIVEWSDNTEIESIKKFTIGIMPLCDTPWTRGKCGYKLVQYMGGFLPVIASPVGVNKKIVDNGTDGFLANTKDEWMEAIQNLYHNNKLRERMGTIGRSKIEKAYSLQANISSYSKLIIKCGQ